MRVKVDVEVQAVIHGFVILRVGLIGSGVWASFTGCFDCLWAMLSEVASRLAFLLNSDMHISPAWTNLLYLEGYLSASHIRIEAVSPAQRQDTINSSLARHNILLSPLIAFICLQKCRWTKDIRRITRVW